MLWINPQRPRPPWTKNVQTLSNAEIQKIEANIKAGKLTEEQAKPLLLEAGLRAAGKVLADEAI